MDCGVGSGQDCVPTLKGLEDVFQNIFGVVLGIAGITLFLLIIVAGAKFMMAGGDEKRIESTRKTLTYAIGGLLLIILSYLIIKFFEFFTGANLTEFVITQP